MQDIDATQPIAFDQAASEALIAFAQETLQNSATAFEAARLIARRLGAHRVGNHAEIGFWAPELIERRVLDGDVFLEVLEPAEPLNLAVARQSVRFRRTRVPVLRTEAYCFAAISGMVAGTRERVGHFYALTWRDAEGAWHRILDPLAASLPFGAFAPAEYYDTDAMQAARSDRAYFAAMKSGEEPVKLGPVTNILQVHVPTATAGMTLASLTRHIEHIAERCRQNLDHEPADRLYMGYDAFQLLPVEPTTVYEAGPAFWTEAGE
ncbi:MAG: glucosylglycerol hydrolase, partial [Pseudomonadota bacterium]